MHITGGLGAVHGIEGFGPQYLLPNADAFNETCAAVGNVLFNFRMFLAHKDAKYLDVAEISLLNNVLGCSQFGGQSLLLCQSTRGRWQIPFQSRNRGEGTLVRNGLLPK